REQRVLVDARLRDHLYGNGGRRVADVDRVAVVPVVPEVQPGLVAQVLVDADERLIDVVRGLGIRLHVRGGCPLRRCREVVQQVQGDGRQLRARNDVAGKRLTGERILDGRRDFGKVALPHQRGGHGDEAGRQRVGAYPFVRAHEERFVVAVVHLRN